MKKLLLFLIFLYSFGHSPAVPQDESPEAEPAAIEPEAQAVLFPLGDDSDEVDLYIKGSWNASLAYTALFGIDPFTGELLFPYPVPGFPEFGFSFIQNPDLFASVVLKDRFFLTAGFTSDLRPNRLSLGYKGRESDFLQSLVLGNTGFSFPQYPYLPFGISGEKNVVSDPGGMAVLAGPRSIHHLLLKAETSEREVIRFRGMNRIYSTLISSENYITDRYFLLPDSSPEDVELYIEAYSPGYGSESTFYRPAEPDEAVLLPEAGIVVLAPEVPGRVLVFYRKNGLPVGSPALGENSLIPLKKGIPDSSDPGDFSWDSPDFQEMAAALGRAPEDFRIQIGEKDFLLLRDPGFYSPFELKDRYPFPEGEIEGGSVSAALVIYRTGEEIALQDGISAVIEADPAAQGRIIRLISRASEDPVLSLRHPENRYPLIGRDPLIYGISGFGEISETGISVRSTVPVDEISLGPGVIPGTVRLYREGITENLFSVDYESGKVTLFFTPSAGEDLKFSFRRNSGSPGFGDISFASGNRIFLSDNSSVFGTMAFRWDLTGSRVSLYPEEHTGGITVSAGAESEWETGSAEIAAGASYTNPDTAGLLRTAGMSGSSLRFPVFPGSILPSGTPGELSGIPLDHSARGELYYKNYTQETASGTVLKRYDWELPPENIYPYAPGEPAGPYTASAGAELEYPSIMVLDYAVEQPETWVGGMAEIPADGERDLSGFSSVSFSWKIPEGNSLEGISAYFSIGSLTEDTDGDGILDTAGSALLGGYPFNDQTRGIILSAGTGGEGEDLNRNGLLDRERSGKVVTREIDLTSPPDGSGWHKTEFILSAEEKRALTEVRGWRIIIIRDSEPLVSGRMLVSAPVLEGSSFYTSSGETVLREQKETDIPSPLTGFDDTADKLVSGSGVNNVLTVIPLSDPAAITRFIEPVQQGAYRYFSFYMLLSDVPADNLFSVKLSASEEIYTEALFTAEPESAGQWIKVTVDLKNSTILVNGEEPADSSVTVRGASGIKPFTKLTVTMESLTGYTVYFDEFHFTGPVQAVGAGIFGQVQVFRESPLVLIGDFPLIQNVSARAAMEVKSPEFYSDVNSRQDGRDGVITGTVSGKGTVGYVDTSGVFGFSYGPGWGFTGGHTLTFPSFPWYVTITDSFQKTFDLNPASLSRTTGLFVTIPRGGTYSVQTESSASGGELYQFWDFIALSPDIPGLSAEGVLSLANTAGGFTVSSDVYPAAWIRNYRLVLPYRDGDRHRRESNLSVSLLGTIGRTELTAYLDGTAVNTSDITGTQENSGAYQSGIKYRTSEEQTAPWAGLLYTRKYQFTTVAGSSLFTGDWYGYFQSRRLPYIYRTVPVAELYSGALRELFAETTEGLYRAGYNPSAEISAGRSFGYGPVDLYIPASGSLKLYRRLERKGTAVSDIMGADFSAGFRAVNLFGTGGTDPVFSFYKTGSHTGSFFWGYKFRHDFSGTGSVYSEEWQTRLSSLIIINMVPSSASLETRLSSAYSEYRVNELYIKPEYTWQSAPPLLGSPLLRDLAKKGAKLVHKESLRITGRRNYGNLTDSQGSLALGHSTSFTVPDRGFLALSLQAVMAREKVSEPAGGTNPDIRNLYMFGFSVGIEGSFSY
ncbi:MAG: hypothetical protein ACLFSE_01145 [Spirochaetia bacterium]